MSYDDEYYDDGLAEQMEHDADYEHEIAIADYLSDRERDDAEHARRRREW